MKQAVFRFAPSPNGKLHLGHAYSALLNEQMALASGGRLLLRIEDIDQQRCTPANITTAREDLRWLGIAFEEPVLQQSSRMTAYRDAISVLTDLKFLYVCNCTRKQLAAAGSETMDPDHQPLYPGTCRANAHLFDRYSALRLNMAMAVQLARQVPEPLTWCEKDECVAADPRVWGDVILARKDIGTSYHLSVVVDDAFQGVTDIVRGEDLYHATAIHRLLQTILGFPEPRYHHHALITHASGRKLAKSESDRSLADMRRAGATPDDIRAMLGFKNQR